MQHRVNGRCGSGLAAALLLTGAAAALAAGVTKVERVSVSSAGEQGNSYSSTASVSADGRYVAFQSQATDLVPGDTNGAMDIFVRDRTTRTTARVSLSSAGAQADNGSYEPAISADGRFVAFESDARNLVPGDTNNSRDIFIRDRMSGTTERVSLSSTGAEGDGTGFFPTGLRPAISANGRFVAFESFA